MENKVVLDGISFVASGRDYFYNAQRRLYLHRYIWEKENGPIKEGFQIHHIDGNPRNNDISNLQCVNHKDHIKIHNSIRTKEHTEKKRKHMIEVVIPASAKWHKSENGREWHKEHYNNNKDKLHVDIIIKCTNCGKDCEVRNVGVNKFCSNACKSSYRRKNGLDNEKRVCECCKNEFSANKYSKTKTCSRSCANKIRYTKR